MNQLKCIIFIVSFLFSSPLLAENKDVYPWSFPRDHGAHHKFNTEWWYFTGHLQDKKNEKYGFELTFFRVNLSDKNLIRNQWSSDHIYFAHFAVTDDKRREFSFIERHNRGVLGMAGAQKDTLNVWNGDWRVSIKENDIFLQTKTKEIDLNLKLNLNSPLILHGKNGYSVKTNDGSQSSYYYSMPRLVGEGSLRIHKDMKEIESAHVWFDHEFFDSKFPSSNATESTGSWRKK